MRYDAEGWPIPDRASAHRCECCRRKFAAGHVPTDGLLICRDCRAEQEAAAPPDQPDLFAEAI
ncbi:hypothetical protein PBI_SCHIEBS_21 [Gordonia phage Schiebs]|nr:hypothetical protein PBI_SCHIEBS_21 [Gordonia phage Schiebs]